jgi:hypothetical protein
MCQPSGTSAYKESGHTKEINSIGNRRTKHVASLIASSTLGLNRQNKYQQAMTALGHQQSSIVTCNQPLEWLVLEAKRKYVGQVLADCCPSHYQLLDRLKNCS